MVYVALQNAYMHAKTRFYLTANRATGLLAKGKITQDLIKLLDKWRHTGFISDSYPTLSVDDYVIDPDTPVEAYF